MESTSIYAALAAVQSELKAPKGQMNTFGGYRYRSCEDILEAVKPILKAHDLLLTLSDEPKVLEGWHYIEATAKLESLDPKPTQAIQPYEYGHPYSKKTLLWERGVPPLHPTNIVEPTATWCPSGSYSHKHGEQHKGMFTTDRAKNRAKTFPGVAKAMSEQWG